MSPLLALALIPPLALALDAWWGEPRRLHPLVGFGNLTQALENRLHDDSRARGALALAILVLPPVFLVAWVGDRLWAWPGGWPWGTVLDLLVLYFAIGWRSLEDHARRVGEALTGGDLPGARRAVSNLVSRDTADLDAPGVARATVESVLENGNDAIFGAIFWFLVAGAPGAILYRLTNTLDAMWGYRTPRYRHFGWAAARLDDLLNWAPARLTALAYALVGHFRPALACWRAQGRRWKSPNAGPVMAAGAGSLGILLGGAASYHGAMQDRPPLGLGRPAQVEDIFRALRLIRRALALWLVTVPLLALALS
jgi:adenosylcobinamide-phosphate synthase